MSLPVYSHEHQLEDESLVELRRLLQRRFIVREERSQDYGVDVSIEVLLDGRATNYRALVQVKARSKLAPNADGSMSLSIESSNIEYLLNSASSIVVLYDADRKTLYWCDVFAATAALQAGGVDYQRQKSVTLRFENSLRGETVDVLRDEVLVGLRSARMLRAAIGGLRADGLVHVDAAGEWVTTDETEREFFSVGWRLAARGSLSEMQRKFGLLRPAVQSSGRARLLMAHAHASSGQAVAAWAHSREARRRLDELSRDDRDLLDLIDIGVDHALGRSQPADLANREEAVRRRASPDLRIQLDVAALRHEVTLSGDPERFGEFASRATSLVAQMTSAVGPSHPATLSARALEVEIRGSELAYEYARLLMTCSYGDGAVGIAMRRGITLQEGIDRSNVRYTELKQLNETARALCAEWPMLVLELERASSQADVVLLRNTRLMAVSTGGDSAVDLDSPPCAELLERIRETRRRANALAIDEVEVKLRLLEVELLDLADRRDDEKAEAQALLSLCQACGYAHIEQEARRHVSGTSMFREQRAEMVSAKEDASRQALSRATPQERLVFAQNLRALLCLPADRIQNILDDVECSAFEYELQETFCRYLDVASYELLSETAHTLYAQPALRRCECAKRNIVSSTPSRLWPRVVADFQRSCCVGCAERAPLIE